jgi:hypothetical protein
MTDLPTKNDPDLLTDDGPFFNALHEQNVKEIKMNDGNVISVYRHKEIKFGGIVILCFRQMQGFFGLIPLFSLRRRAKHEEILYLTSSPPAGYG